jgi:DNA-binding transcriptional MerR regulator
MDGKTRSELARELGVSRVSLWRYEQAGLILAATPVGPNRSVYSATAEQVIRNLVGAEQ